MLLAYIDEIGEPGAFVSKTHPNFNTSPAFGYAGFVVPEEKARGFGSVFTKEKRLLFKKEIEQAGSPGQWERKGASIFRPTTPDTHAQYLRVFKGLVRSLRGMGGMLFYYADEKPLGTPKQTRSDPVARETAAMRETLNRLCTYAERRESYLMVMIDQINEKTRAERLPNMYGHILSRAAERQEMKRVIEPPMHVDSVLSANIQFADWVAAAVTRAIEFQAIHDSAFHWVPDQLGDAMNNAFTFESKLHLWLRSVEDLNHHAIFRKLRPLHPPVQGQRLGAGVDPDVIRRVHAAAERQALREAGR